MTQEEFKLKKGRFSALRTVAEDPELQPTERIALAVVVQAVNDLLTMRRKGIQRIHDRRGRTDAEVWECEAFLKSFRTGRIVLDCLNEGRLRA